LRHGGGTVGATNRQVSVAFSRRLSLAMLAVVLLMVATVVATLWMARQQDTAAQTASRRMVAGGIEAFVESTKTTLLDYAIWTDAYENIVAGDIDWIASNIGSSAEIETFDLVLILPPRGTPFGWDLSGGPRGDVLEPAAIAIANRLLDDVPIDSGTAEAVYVRSGDALWFLAVGRVVPHDVIPAGLADADVPRLVIGFEVTTELLGDIGRRFLIENLAVGPERPVGEDVIALDGVDGSPLAWVSWTAPTPGRAVLRATLWPLVGLMLAVSTIVLLVSRELVRSARRLEGALVQARAADRTKTEFLSNVSHELRTPLNGVIGVAQLLQMREMEPEARHMLDILLASAHSQLQLVNGLLDIARIESGMMTLDQRPFDPAEVLEDTVRLIAPEIAEKRLALRVTITADARQSVVGDALAFRQIATNLIGNALKFTDRGGIAVELRTAATGALVLAVSDTGVGIDPAEHDRIFERFVQVDGATTRRVGGAGLGLAITRALVELTRGSIRVTSTLGEGATFTVELPLPAADAVASAA
jgi:signal transduction histidine kinase